MTWCRCAKAVAALCSTSARRFATRSCTRPIPAWVRRHRPDGRCPVRRSGLREVLVHMIEEYARHMGHADLLRERIEVRHALPQAAPICLDRRWAKAKRIGGHTAIAA
jgi:hypothetical protein